VRLLAASRRPIAANTPASNDPHHAADGRGPSFVSHGSATQWRMISKAAAGSRTGEALSAAERRGRILAMNRMLTDITEWGWPEAPPQRLVFVSDLPKLPRPLARHLTPDLDRCLARTLETYPDRLGAEARATGLRIGELVDLKLDCVHEIHGAGAWLKVPLGDPDSERMVPLDEETVAIIGRIAVSPGKRLLPASLGPDRIPCDLYRRVGRPYADTHCQPRRAPALPVLRSDLASTGQQARSPDAKREPACRDLLAEQGLCVRYPAQQCRNGSQ
jgi:integrase